VRRATSIAAAATVALCLLAGSASAAELSIFPPTPAPLPQKLSALLHRRAQVTVPRSSSLSQFNLDANGYRVVVAGVEETVVVEVERKRDKKFKRAITAYVARGTVSSSRISASFGSLGKVDVRFKPSGKVEKSKPRRHCRGPNHFTSRLGVFVGKIDFPGENGYLSAKAHRAKGKVRFPLNLDCRSAFLPFRPGRAKRPTHRVKPALFEATWRHAVDSTLFIAARGLLLRDKAIYLALSEHSAGRVAVLHAAESIGSPKAFTVSNALTRASLSPPAPFDGKGLYSAAPDGSRTWGGPLTASFPGAPRFPLAGPEFETELEVGF
jgi:hypothetical protein